MRYLKKKYHKTRDNFKKRKEIYDYFQYLSILFNVREESAVFFSTDITRFSLQADAEHSHGFAFIVIYQRFYTNI